MTDARSAVARNASWLTLGTLVTRLSGLVLVVVLARALGVDDYGLYAYAIAIGALLDPVADAGMTPYLTREVARRADAAALTRRLFALRAAIVGAIVAVTLVVTLATTHGDARWAIVAIVASLLLDGTANMAFAYFQGRERMAFEGGVTAVMAILRALGAAAIALATEDLLAVMVWLLLSSAVQAGVALRRVGRDVGGLRGPAGSADVDWRSVFAMGAIAVFAIGYLRADSVIIGVALDREAVGLYAAAYALVFALHIVPLKVTTALMPVFARTHATDLRTFVETWHGGMLAALAVVLPLTLTTSLLAEDLMTWLFGSAFDEGGTALAVLAWSSPLWAANMVLTGVLRGVGLERVVAAGAAAGLALNLGINVWAIAAYGIEAAAAVTVATELLVLLVLGTVCARRRVVPWPRLPLARLALALLAGAAAAVACQPLNVILAAGCSLAAYALVVVVTGAIGREQLRVLLT